MLFTGDLVPVEDLTRWGVFEVVAPDQLESRARSLGERMAAAAPLAVRKLKVIVRETSSLSIVDALYFQAGPDLYSSEDRLEGLRAWRDKRSPLWKGRCPRLGGDKPSIDHDRLAHDVGRGVGSQKQKRPV